MFAPTRFLPLLLFLATAATPTFAADKLNPATPPVAMPAFLDYVTFSFTEQGEDHKIIVTSGPTLLRFDELNEGFSVIYNPATDYYIGLENRNYTWWDFSWPEVKASVEKSKRYEKRLQDLGSEGLDGDSINPAPKPAPNTTNLASNSALGGSDDSGYVWTQTKDHLKIADLPCVRWIGESVSGGRVEAWCYSGHLPKIEAAIANLRKISNPMALVPVRSVAPDFIYPVYDALGKGGNTPILINWGDDSDRQQFRLNEAKTREGKASLFTVPKLFVKTTLVTMDGMTDKQPAQAPRGTPVAPRVDHLTPQSPNLTPQ